MFNIFQHIVDLLFPETCAQCHKKGTPLCDACVLTIQIPDMPTSPDIYACFDYKNPTIKHLIWRLKYNNHKSIGSVLGTLLYERNIDVLSDIQQLSGQKIIVIPAPLHKNKRKQRGYNQSEILAKHFINAAPPGTYEMRTDIIKKVKHTAQQANIHNRKKRLENIKNAFIYTNGYSVAGRTCIIIDDVVTTGGTIGEITSLLKQHKAKKVYGFTVAH